MKAAEDFMRVVLEGYVVAAASQIMDSKPWNGNVAQLADEVVTKHVRILPDDIPDTKDKVYTYACEVLSLGLLWYNYLDAIREGDGKRVMMMWKFLLVIFKKTGHRNYAKEAAVMLIQYHFLLSDHKASQLRNSRSAAAVGFQDSLIKTLGRWESTAYQLYVRIPRGQLAGVLAMGRPSLSITVTWH